MYGINNIDIPSKKDYNNIVSWTGAQSNLWGKSEHRRAIALDNVKPGWPEEKCNRKIPLTMNFI